MDKKKIINLYVKIQFTNESPNSEPISIGIVSDDINDSGQKYKSFYAEFIDFDVLHCSEDVKENVVDKLNKTIFGISVDGGTYYVKNTTKEIKNALHEWFKQFDDYNIQIIVDNGALDWYCFLQLMSKMDYRHLCSDNICDKCDFLDYVDCYNISPEYGIPYISSNIHSIPIDIKNVIQHFFGMIGVSMVDYGVASINRQNLLYLLDAEKSLNNELYEVKNHVYSLKSENRNDLFTAKVIKRLYKILNNTLKK